MTLAFSQKLNSKPTYFVDKILVGLKENKLIDFNEFCFLESEYINRPFSLCAFNYPNEKIHTIRQDIKNKWKPGNKIHFVINNRTKNRYQFAPTIVCTSTQQIIIKYFYNGKTEQFDLPTVLIDGKEIKGKQLLALANNDGFDTVEDFFAYFKTDFTGKIIHWTNFKY